MPKNTLKFNEPDKTIKTRMIKATKTDKTPLELSVGVLRDRRISSTSSVDSNAENFVPGAVIITTEESAKGDDRYKVFMVTPERKLAPVEMDSETIATLVAEKSIAELPLTPNLPERNVTIPEDNQGNVKSSGQENEASVEENSVLTTENDLLIPEPVNESTETSIA